MNNVNLIGNLTKEIELKKSTSGVSVCSFSIAVRRDYKNAQGEYDTDFINCIAWRQTAEFLTKYATKGDKLAVNGVLQVRSYDGKDGKKVYVTEVVCNKAEIVHSNQKIETNETKNDNKTLDVTTDVDDFFA